jgi:hypothetical protein
MKIINKYSENRPSLTVIINEQNIIIDEQNNIINNHKY